MSDAQRCRTGDWVEIERVLFEPSERSGNLPDETAEQPMLMWVKGFAWADVELGGELTIETMTGRAVTGRLSAVNPGYTHTFGDPAPELVNVGRDVRARVRDYRQAVAEAGE
jgi:hypothetical protein